MRVDAMLAIDALVGLPILTELCLDPACEDAASCAQLVLTVREGAMLAQQTASSSEAVAHRPLLLDAVLWRILLAVRGLLCQSTGAARYLKLRKVRGQRMELLQRMRKPAIVCIWAGSSEVPLAELEWTEALLETHRQLANDRHLLSLKLVVLRLELYLLQKLRLLRSHRRLLDLELLFNRQAIRHLQLLVQHFHHCLRCLGAVRHLGHSLGGLLHLLHHLQVRGHF
mmetsp:Transcript_91240/g.254068  ORF Transcript_91240/g.254068 Transcript_91240/m.254068 type:complete len:227 (-) Transcript_91240:1818-2498(-)